MTRSTTGVEVVRARPGDAQMAARVFTTMAEVFEEESEALPVDYVERLLARDDFWLVVAVAGGEVVGGLTAHTLPMTREACSELFIYDLAVRADHRRRGIGRALVEHAIAAARAAGIAVAFVPADDEDVGAIELYRAIGGKASPVTFFTFGEE